MTISEAQQKKIEEIAWRHGLKLVVLFGSQATGRTHRESDVDIAVLPEGTLTFEQEVRLTTELIDVLGNVDLTNIKRASPLLLFAVCREGRVLYQSEPLAFSSLRAYAFRKYVETKPLYEARARHIAREIAKL